MPAPQQLINCTLHSLSVLWPIQAHCNLPNLQVISAGWTLSPLQPEYLQGQASHQCLVTLVLKLDLGGWLSSSGGSFMGRLLEPLMYTPLGSTVRNAFLQPLMTSVISLRDKVCCRSMLAKQALDAIHAHFLLATVVLYACLVLVDDEHAPQLAFACRHKSFCSAQT